MTQKIITMKADDEKPSFYTVISDVLRDNVGWLCVQLPT